MRVHAFLAMLVLAACGPPPSAPPAAAPAGPPTVAVTAVVSQLLAKAMRLPGELQANRDVAVHARVQGFVEKIEVDRGSAVKQGQVLLQLVAPEMAASCAEAAAKLASTEATYKRLKEASGVPGVVAGNDLEIAARAVDADRARARVCQENQQYLRITAPFDGVITERNVHEGSLVGPASSAPLVRLQEVLRLRLVVAVPEVAAGGVSAGEKVTFTVPAFPGVPFQGTVARVARALDVKTRSMPVELDVDNAAGKLAPGMFPELHWQMRRSEPTLFVPPSAIVATTEKIFVIRVKDGTAEWVDVRPGVSTGSLVEVFGALAAGDTVALRGTDELRVGSKVTVKEAGK